MSVDMDFIISYHYSLLIKLFKLFTLSITLFSRTSSTWFVLAPPCLAQPLQHPLPNCSLVKVDLSSTSRQGDLPGGHVTSTNALSSCYATAAVPENNFDKML